MNHIFCRNPKLPIQAQLTRSAFDPLEQRNAFRRRDERRRQRLFNQRNPRLKRSPPTPAGLLRLSGDDFPILHGSRPLRSLADVRLIRRCIYPEPSFDLLRRNGEVLGFGRINHNCDLSSQNLIYVVREKKPCCHDGSIAFVQKFIDC